MFESASGGSRWARLRAQEQSRYPATYRRTWFPVLEYHPDPALQALPGYIWLAMPEKVQSVWALHFEIVEAASAARNARRGSAKLAAELPWGKASRP